MLKEHQSKISDKMLKGDQGKVLKEHHPPNLMFKEHQPPPRIKATT